MSSPFPSGRFPAIELVVTPKSRSAIPVAHPLGRDVVLQAALDPTVTAIEYVRTVHMTGGSYQFDGIVLVRDGQRYALELGRDEDALRTLDEEGLGLLAAERLNATPLGWWRADVLREPRCSNARLVWENARHRIALDRRMAVLDLLDRHGSMVLRDYDGPPEHVFALACEAVVDIDLAAADIGSAEIRRTGGSFAPRANLWGGLAR